MFGLGRLGKLGSVGRALAAWTPAQLWPLGATSPGMWIDPPYVASLYQDSAGTTAISAIGTVLDTSNPIGLILDRKGSATALADPGIHLSQATATSRPVASARVNLLTKSEVFSDASVWVTIVNVSVSTNTTTAPDGATTADTLTESSATGVHFLGQASTASTTGVYTISCYAKKKERSILCLGQTSGSVTPINSSRVWFDLNAGTVGTASAGYSGTITSVGNGWYRCAASATFTVSSGVIAPFVGISTADNQTSYAGDGTSGLYIWGAQLNLGSTALPYQRVGATASDYDASAGPTYTKLDGVDDSLSSATFAAGTLTSSMDCLMAVRRDSAVTMILGLYETAGGGKFFGTAQSGGAFDCVSGCGAPTVWVNGVQLAGGTAVQAGTLHTATPPGNLHIVEFRGLDLSAWTSLSTGNFGSGYRLNGALGEIQLFASGQDANRDLSRAQMAAYFGVTLP